MEREKDDKSMFIFAVSMVSLTVTDPPPVVSNSIELYLPSWLPSMFSIRSGRRTTDKAL